MDFELGNGKLNKMFTSEEELKRNRYFIDESQIDINDENNYMKIIVDRIKENTVVLDIGCAQGKFGKYLKQYKNCEVYGIEINDEAIQYVKENNFYADVFKLNIEDYDINDQEYKRYSQIVKNVDYIIIADVLEHLSNPTKVLMELNLKLKENGQILISVPNIGHADIALNLIEGKFNYTDLGILDNTHLKFFTKKSFLDWINQMNQVLDGLNFDCEYIGGTIHYNKFLIEAKEKYPKLYDIIMKNDQGNLLQILFSLKKLKENEFPVELSLLLKENQIEILSVFEKELNQTLRKDEIEWYDSKVEYCQSQLYKKELEVEMLKSEYLKVCDMNDDLRKEYFKICDMNYKLNVELKDRIEEYNLIFSENLKNRQEVSNLKNEFEEKYVYIKNIEDNIEKLIQRNQILENELDDIKKSLSWKLLKPLRFFKKQ